MIPPSRRRLQKLEMPASETLAPDLEWLLSSRQTSKDLILEALLREYYQQVLLLALGLIWDTGAARRAAISSIGRAVRVSERYRSGMDIDAWFLGVIWQNLLKIARGLPVPAPVGFDGESGASVPQAYWLLPEEERLVTTARVVLGWNSRQISAAARITEDEAELISWRANRRLAGSDFENEVSAFLAERVASANALPPDFDALLVSARRSLPGQNWLRMRTYGSGEPPVLYLVLLLLAVTFWAGSKYLMESPTSPQPQARPPMSAITGAQDKPPVPAWELARVAINSPTPTQSPVPTSTPTPSGIFYQPQGSQRLDVIAARLGVSVTELRQANRIPADYDYSTGNILIIPGRLNDQVNRSATPVVPLTTTLQLDSTDIGTDISADLRVNTPRYSTLWLDALILVRSPQNDRPSQLAWRMQLWLGGEQALLIGGPAGSEPTDIYLWVDNGNYVARPELGNPWFEPMGERGDRTPPIDMHLLFGIAMVLDNSDSFNTAVRLVGEDIQAGRPAWIVDDANGPGVVISRRWIDQATGFTLRKNWLMEQPFTFNPGGPYPDEIVVQSITFDVDFPQELFNPKLPWRGGYARDYSGEPISVSAPPLSWLVPPSGDTFGTRPLPDDLDISQSKLALLYRFDSASPQRSLEIFAGGYSLGSVDIQDPWRLWCQRSPDGRLLAYIEPSSWYSDFPLSSSGPFWVDLTELDQIHNVFPQASRVSSYFAISPDSTRIAFWGCSRPEDLCGLYVKQIEQDILNLVFPNPGPMGYFAWSPDGLYLAGVTQVNELVVVRLSDEKVVFREDYNPATDAIPMTAPLLNWGMPFPLGMLDMEHCALPPKSTSIP